MAVLIKRAINCQQFCTTYYYQILYNVYVEGYLPVLVDSTILTDIILSRTTSQIYISTYLVKEQEKNCQID